MLAEETAGVPNSPGNKKNGELPRGGRPTTLAVRSEHLAGGPVQEFRDARVSPDLTPICVAFRGTSPTLENGARILAAVRRLSAQDRTPDTGDRARPHPVEQFRIRGNALRFHCDETALFF